MKLDLDRISRFLLLLGVLAPITMMVVVIVVGQITPNYNPISDTISQMGTPNSPYSSVLNNSIIIYGALIGATAYGFYRRLRNTVMGNTLVILLSIHAIGTILLAVFPDSPEFVGKHFADDILHNALSAISYPALLMGMLVFAGIARREKVLRVTATIGLAVVILNLPMPFITMFGPLKSMGGLIQRLFMAGSFLWLACTSLLLFKNSGILQKSGRLEQSGRDSIRSRRLFPVG
jgi:hypothetical membrane protein